MANAATIAVRQLMSFLGADDGLAAECARLPWDGDGLLAPLTATELLDVHAPADLMEKSTAQVKYPIVHVYCEKLVNALTEKFRAFSGTAELAIDVRVSHEHARELQKRLGSYLDAITNLLHRKRGTWPGGMFYAGDYEVSFQPVKRGGRSFVQGAVVRLRVHISAGS